jgi:transposase
VAGPGIEPGSDALAALILSGVEECSECAKQLDVPKDTVSKWAKKLQKAGTIRIEGRKYPPPPADNKQTGK